jgi:hypothetical protein
MHRVLTIALLLLAPLLADDTAARDKLIGSWREDGKAAAVWTLETRGEELHVLHSLPGGKDEEFQCNIMGRDCDVKLAGKHARVSLWFNGGMLVELEQRGTEIVKRRFRIASDGDAMEIELIPVAPIAKSPTTIRCQKVQTVAQQK